MTWKRKHDCITHFHKCNYATRYGQILPYFQFSEKIASVMTPLGFLIQDGYKKTYRLGLH